MFAGITNALYSFLNWIQGWTVYWGIAIIVFTIIVRLVLTPLDIKSRASMRKTQKLQPQLQVLQKKYANDKEKLNAKTAELYKKAHVNPLSSCLPMLLTWPILIAVFGAMRTAANKEILNQVAQILSGQEPTLEPFLWFKNLWMPDNPFYSALPNANTLQMISQGEWETWFNGLQGNMPPLLAELNLTAESFTKQNLGATIQAIIDAMSGAKVLMADGTEYLYYAEGVRDLAGASIPLLGSLKHMFNGLLLLPILSAVSQLAMTKLMGGNQATPTEGPGAGSGKFMKWFFPIFSAWICLSYSSAFALYWVAGNLVSMGQTFLINKYLDRKESMAAPVAGEGSVK